MATAPVNPVTPLTPVTAVTPVTPAFDVDALADAFLLDWTDHPQEGPLTELACLVGRPIARYLFDEATIEIDIGGPQMSISRRSRELFDAGFALNDSVLLGDNLAGRLPIHLLFRTPMRAVGASVSASGAFRRGYLAQCALLTDDGQWHAVPPRLGTLSRDPGTAPFMGGTASPQRTIVAAWFDVVDPRNRSDFPQVAINGLHFLPA